MGHQWMLIGAYARIKHLHLDISILHIGFCRLTSADYIFPSFILVLAQIAAFLVDLMTTF
jgi:hypothetical protein